MFTVDWSIASLTKSINPSPVYHTPLDDPVTVRDSIFIERPSPKRSTKKEETIFYDPFQIELSKIKLEFRKWETILSENVICLTGNKDHPNVYLIYMLFCLVNQKPFNLSYYMVKIMVSVIKNDMILLPYGMLLTRLYSHVRTIQLCPIIDAHFLTVHVMVPLTEGRTKRFMVDEKRPHPQTSSSSFSTQSQPQDQEQIDPVDNFILNLVEYYDQLPPIPGASKEYKQTRDPGTLCSKGRYPSTKGTGNIGTTVVYGDGSLCTGWSQCTMMIQSIVD
ncbi:hypothetical protein Tco_1484788 [Tanacetum coccineum]